MNKDRCGKEAQFVLLNAGELVVATSGRLIAGTNDSFCCSVVIDSRSVIRYSLFIALKGESQDGHSFVEDAIKKGASLILVTHDYAIKNSEYYATLSTVYNVAFVSVENTLFALQQLAKFYLSKMKLKLKIGITGSSGKTTVKELVGSLFSQSYDTFISEGNLNSETGLPLSIFMLRPHHEVGIFEMGMNRKGEIRELAEVLYPDVGIITNIGQAHIGMLGSVEIIAREKKEIFSRFNESCVAFIPECEFTSFLMDGIKGKVVVFSVENLKSHVDITEKGLLGTVIRYEEEMIAVPLLGSHNVKNVILLLSVGEYFNFSPKKIKCAIESVKIPFGRAQLKKGLTTCFFDCYNANPSSMRDAIQFCNSLNLQTRKIYVLASMLELGSESLGEHRKMCELIFNSDCECVYLYGNEIINGFKKYKESKTVNNSTSTDISRKNVYLYEDNEFEKLEAKLKQNIKKGDFVFLKGSRSLALERLENVLGL